MVFHSEIKENCYYDSVTLMLFSSRLLEVAGVKQAAVMMATAHNKVLMANAGILDSQTAERANPNDLLIGILAEDEKGINTALQILAEQFNNKEDKQVDVKKVKTMDAALKKMPAANFAVISLPGNYAKFEAMKAMRQGMHVLLFSDNVSIEDENELKDFAVENNLLMMGPDCGTAVINGVGLGFANVVKRGNIGLVAAAGTGLQEVLVLIDKMEGGISQALGTGGRDISEEIGGKMMLMELEALANDDNTKVIGIISKPPKDKVMLKILDYAKSIKKPLVACFLGSDGKVIESAGMKAAKTLQDAAAMLVSISKEKEVSFEKRDIEFIAKEECRKLKEGQKYIRGLYSGGTLCYEAALLLEEEIGFIYSNLSKEPKYHLKGGEKSKEHTLIDMGDDFFTDGMPHPMIDTRLRSKRILEEGRDKETAVILLDCVLGYGCHEDPAQALIDAHEIGKAQNSELNITYITSVCGSDLDIQKRDRQVEKLEQAGIIVMPSNKQAAELAGRIVLKKANKRSGC